MKTKMWMLLVVAVAAGVGKQWFMLIIPGFVAAMYSGEKRWQGTEKLMWGMVWSLAYWVVVLWLSKWVSLPIWVYQWLTLLGTMVYILFTKREMELLSGGWGWVAGIFGLVIVGLYAQVYWGQLAPAGTDMTMQGYIARQIVETGGFPKTYRPLLPVDHFGLYPVGFPMLAAGVTLWDGMPVYQSVLFMTFVSFVIMSFGLYLLGRVFFSPIVSAVSAGVVVFLSYYVHSYLAWGGAPTVLSAAFCVLTVVVAMEMIGEDRFKPGLIILALAAFFTHATVAMGAVFVGVGVLLVGLGIFGKLRKYTWKHKRNLAWLICFLPLILTYGSYRFSSQQESFFKTWQRKSSFSWTGNIKTAITSVPWYVREMYGDLVPVAAMIGFVGLLVYDKKWGILVGVAYLGIAAIVINSQYWVLPFSQILYPDRILMLLVVPFLLSIGWYVGLIGKKLGEDEVGKGGGFTKAMWAMILGLVMLFVYWSARDSYREVLSVSVRNVSLTFNDLNAMEWLKEHTAVGDVIINDWRDGGMWIPAVIYRPVTFYHTNPLDEGELDRDLAGVEPRWLYVGEDMVYSQDPLLRRGLARSLVEKYPASFILEHAAGGAQVYKIIDNEVWRQNAYEDELYVP